MFRTILLYRWNSILEPLLYRNIENIAEKCVTFYKPIKDFYADSESANELIEVIHKEKVEAIITLNYFPLLSTLAELNHLPYMAWIYDSPLYTTLSPAIQTPYTYLFCFDRKFAQELCDAGAYRVYHFPLAADCDLFQSVLVTSREQKKYQSDISFVGNLYNSKNNRLANADLSDYTKGYVEAVICAQQKIYGYNLIKESLNEQVVTEIAKKCELELGVFFPITDLQIVKDAIDREISSRDRMELLRTVSKTFPVELYCKTKAPDELLQNGKLHVNESVDYVKQMPLVFHHSRINLNTTARGIESGIPQRVIDILACGGFCLTNYQPEIAEFFENGKELVMYSELEEVNELIAYYLKHEEERQRIALAGERKVRQEFHMETKLRKMFAIVEKELEEL